jgi:hypothetical protein
LNPERQTSVFRSLWSFSAERLAAAGLLLFLLPMLLQAHTPSETYLTFQLNGTNLTGQWDVALRDLQQGLGLETMDTRALSAEELSRRQEGLALDTVARLELKADGRSLPLQVTDYLTVALNNGGYARVQFAAEGLKESPRVLDLEAKVLFSIDVAMHGVLRLDHRGRTETAVFNADRSGYRFSLAEPASKWRQWGTFVWEGVWHIWIGFDHILFLVALLLPAVLRKTKGFTPDLTAVGWERVERFRPAFINVLKIVTAFTIAHSITLTLAVLGLVQLPARLVESVIAASVALAALNNVVPRVAGKGWMVAFGFGLVHGFGFANVLGELGLPSGALAVALVGFNVGVELGQLALVALFLPAAFALRGSWFYQTVILKFGSVLVVLIATAWLVERIFGLAFIPF